MSRTFKMIVLNHGQSGAAVAGEPKEFTGWGEPGLSAEGIEEARAAGRKLKELGIKFDIVMTSMQPRAIHTTWLACMESENYAMPIVNSWRLNERSYGELQGMTMEEVEEKFGDELYQKYLRDFNVVPPGLSRSDARHPANSPTYKDVPQMALPKSESMADVCARFMPFWHDTLGVCVAGGMTCLVCAHTGSIRALLKHVQGLKEEDVLLEPVPAGVPFVLELDQNLKFQNRYWLFDEQIVRQKIGALTKPLSVTKALRKGSKYDLIVIGGGPVGVKAAEEAGSRGQFVAIVEPKAVITAVPTGAHSKCLREAALNGAKTWDEVAVVLDTAMKNAHHEAARALRTFHVKTLMGKAFIEDENTVTITNADGGVQTVTTDAIIIATGSKANRFPPVNFDLDGVYDSDTISAITRIPKHLIVQGAGIVSVEYAQIFSKLGSKVTMIDAFGVFLPMLDSSLRQACQDALVQSGIEIMMNTPFKAVEAGDGSTAASPKIKIDLGEKQIECDALLSATGRHALSSGLGLESLEAKGLKINPRGKLIEVDDNGYTGCAKIYAAGDVAAGSMGLATMGQSQAVRAARSLYTKSGLMGSEKKQEVKPFGIWTMPDIAWAGMTEEAAKKAGLNCGVAQVKYGQTVRGCVTGEEGFLKLVFDRDNGVVLGVHIYGDNSCELINYGAEVCGRKSTIFDMLHLVFPAVTYHNLYSIAAAEAKLRLSGVRNLAAATAWKRMQTAVMSAIEGKGVTIKDYLNKAFQAFDEDKSGFLSKEQLKNAVESMGIGVTAENISEMIAEANDDPAEENVDYQTFVEMMSAGQVESDEAADDGFQRQPSKACKELISEVKSVASGDTYDLVVIGAGPVGVTAAQEAGSRGQRTAIIETKPTVTGIPTGAHSKCVREAVLEGAKTWDKVQHVIEKAGDSAHSLAVRNMKIFHVDHFKGVATVTDVNKVTVKLNDKDETRELTANNILIATGSKANRFPPTNFDLPGVYDSDTISSIKRRPDVMVCQGAGIVSVEYGIFFAMMGTKVIIVDAFPTFLGMLDSSMREACKKNLEKNGVEILMSTPFKSVEAGAGSTHESPKIKVDIGDRVLECDTLFSATGRHGLSYGIGLESLADKGLKINPRGKLIEVDENGYTGCGNVYAAGDCATGSMGLATMGQRQAVVAVRAMFSRKTKQKKEVKPSGVWTIPELAWAGITEEKAKADGLNYGTALVDFKETTRGCVSDEEGFLKLVFSKDCGRILGVHLCGENSCELVNYGAEVINSRVTIFEVLHFVFPAVTYHQLYNKAATEGKIRLRGVKDMAAAMAWKKMQQTVEKSLKASGSKETVRESLLHAFEVFDKDQSGFLSEEQLHDAVVRMGLNVSEDDISAMIAEAVGDDVDEEQGIDYETFVKMLT